VAEQFESPWAKTLNGPWTEAKERSQQPCRYCSRPASMTEPGRPWKAHKACAERQMGGQPLGSWDETEVGPGKLEPRALGCGTPEPGRRSGRVCAGKGTEPSCRLCPLSPDYWNPEGPIEFFGTMTQ